jgi:hypothetical protein
METTRQHSRNIGNNTLRINGDPRPIEDIRALYSNTNPNPTRELSLMKSVMSNELET